MRRQLAIFAATAALLALAVPGIVAAASTQAVQGRDIAGHGTLLVASSNQMTVYTFDKDVAGSGTSNCTGGCLANWPALTIAAGDTPTGGAGVTGTLGTIVRADNGATQVTYNGLPLYFFANDKAPGDTNGIYTNWRAVTLAAAPAASATPTASAAPSENPGESNTPPPTSISPGGSGSSSPGDPLPLLLVAGIGAIGLVLAIRRFATARA